MTKNKTKITHIARFAYPHIGGIEAVINQINDSLSNEYFDKEVICCSNIDKSSVENNVKYTRCKYLFDFAANSISPQLFFKMMFLKTDIIHFHMPVIQNVIIWFILYHLGLLRYKKMVVTYHGAIIGYDKYMKPFWRLYKYFYKKADTIHVLSPTIIDSDELLRINKNKCIIIPYGIDVTTTKEKNSIRINEYDINEIEKDRIKLLCMGRLVNWKGFHTVVTAMKKIDNAILFVAGNGPEYKNLYEYIKNNNLNDKVVLLGNVINKDTKNFLFNNIDIFIMPSIRMSESFGIVQLEAMKFGRPVINTNLGTGVNYVSVDKETGLTVEPKNVDELSAAINQLINNEELRLAYGTSAKKRVEQLFNIEKIRNKYQELYLND